MTTFIPAYGALWSVAIASDTVDVRGARPESLASRLRDWHLERALRCYHPGLHGALFALPLHLQAVLGEPAAHP
jgi:spermidine synthase